MGIDLTTIIQGIDYKNVGIGVTVSIILFILSYRKISSANKERINAAYKEILTIIFRNLVIENKVLTLEEINYLQKVKAKEHKIKIIDLPSDIFFLQATYVKMLEQETIPKRKKDLLVLRIEEYLEKIKNKKEQEGEEIEVSQISKDRGLVASLGAISIMAALMTMMGYQFIGGTKVSLSFLTTILVAIVGIIPILLLIQEFIKLKEASEETYTSKKKVAEENIEFEKGIIKELRKEWSDIGTSVSIADEEGLHHFDAIIKEKDREFLVEIKNFTENIPKYAIQNLINKARKIKKSRKTSKLILFLNNKKLSEQNLKELKKEWDYILTKKDAGKIKKIIENE